jgi:MoaA/NifB/PqqE/SkfB family radical SAM enzyme
MCWVPAESRPTTFTSSSVDGELAFEELKSVIDDLGSWHPRLSITGGEPFLHPDLKRFTGYAKNKGFRLNINTNGLLLAKNAHWIAESAVDDVSISIDGPASVHDKIRGLNGAFEQTCGGIRALRRARGVSFKPIIRINTTIMPQNLASLESICDIAEDLQVDCLSYQHLWFVETGRSKWHDRKFKKIFGQPSSNLNNFDLLHSSVDVDLLIRKLQGIQARRSILPFRVYVYPEMKPDDIRHYYSKQPRFLRKQCNSRWSRGDIMPDGTVTPCLSYFAGNIRREPFNRIWNNRRYRRFRQALNKNGVWPGCIRCCGLFSD